MEYLGYIFSIVIGVVLGLTGGGGSILTIPVLVYCFNISPVLATSYSLFIVGSSSLTGAAYSHRKGLVDLKAALYFSSTSGLAIFMVRKLVIPHLLNTTLSVGSVTLNEESLSMIAFAILIITISGIMFTQGPHGGDIEEQASSSSLSFKLLTYGFLAGGVSGLLGTGGGFIIIPALTFLFRLPMKKAVGTSLLIIAMNSSIGCIADLGHFNLNFSLLSKISMCTISGVLVGHVCGRYVCGGQLKKGFGYLALGVGALILLAELSKL